MGNGFWNFAFFASYKCIRYFLWHFSSSYLRFFEVSWQGGGKTFNNFRTLLATLGFCLVSINQIYCRETVWYAEILMIKLSTLSNLKYLNNILPFLLLFIHFSFHPQLMPIQNCKPMRNKNIHKRLPMYTLFSGERLTESGCFLPKTISTSRRNIPKNVSYSIMLVISEELGN